MTYHDSLSGQIFINQDVIGPTFLRESILHKHNAIDDWLEPVGQGSVWD